jgi:hypothetical protein
MICGIGLCANVAMADFGGDFTIYPAHTHFGNRNWIIINAAPGTSTNEKLVLENLSKKQQEINLLVRGAKVENGKFIAEDLIPTDGAGTWIKPERANYNLNPLQKITIPVQITIPRDAEEKQYTAVIFAAKKDPAGPSLNIVTRIGVRIYLNVTTNAALYTNIFTAPEYKSAFFLAISSLGLIGSVLHYLINRKETLAKETISNYEKPTA